MDFKDILKRGTRKLFKGDNRRDNHTPPTQPVTLPPSFRLPTASQRSPVGSSALSAPAPSAKSSPGSPKQKSIEAVSIDAEKDYWPNLTALLGLLGRNALFSPLRVAMDDLSELVRAYESAVTVRTEHEILRSQLEGLFKDLCGYFTGSAPPTMTTSMLNLCRAIQTELGGLQGNQDENWVSRYLQANRDLDEIIVCYRRIRGHLERLMLNANLSTWAIMDKQATESRLAKITPSLSASYNSAEAAVVRRRECTSKTREKVLLDLKTWKDNKAGEKICWLSGMAGTGKTTIAATLCSILDGSHELGANFFCTRSLPECRNVKFIIPTIAYQLARFSTPFQCALSQVLDRDPDVHTKALQLQFKHMILEPFQEVMHTLPTNIVVIIDALDECEDSDGVERILELLLKDGLTLPVKFLISSRPEPHIRERIGNSTSRAQLTLHELDEMVVKMDIETYLRQELSSICLDDGQLATLVEHSGVLFIYAATIVRYIKSGNSPKRLESVLKVTSTKHEASNKMKEIDSLYELVLISALNNPDLEYSEMEQRKLVLHTVICAREPLTVAALAGLLKLSQEELKEAVRPLWSVLHVSESNETGRVSTLHASFSDYILDSSRSKQFSCDARIHNGMLTDKCFKRIEQNQPQFNICNLESSYVFDEDVPNINERINQAIPLDLLYACRYWAIHLNLSRNSDESTNLISEFLSKRLLLWMEVLNLTKRINEAIALSECVISWVQASNCTDSLRSLAQDVRRFVTMFATSPAARSTPHLYISMLASWPSYQPVAFNYAKRAFGLTKLQGVEAAERQLPLLGMIPVGSAIDCVAFSPDGTFFAAGARDNTILVWDSFTYRTTADPIKGHTAPIRSIAISPDSTRICSSSEDGTIRIWSPQNGRLMVGPLGGDSGWIHSIDYSPDGQVVVSGSGDGTIRLWSTKDGQLIGKPLGGDDGVMISVSFSPDGSAVAAASKSFIYLLDPRTGLPIGDPLKGFKHTRTIKFLPDGKHLVSGSTDGTVQIWDLSTREDTGVVQISSFREHLLEVHSIATSSNGITCASASEDCAVRLWDTQTRKTRLLLWHTGVASSVAFSPDGLRLVSGSWDKYVRIWEVGIQDEQIGEDSPQGHIDWVRSIAFSPCRTQIISGCDDMTIRIWDAQTGRPIGNPLKGHTGRIYFVGVSADGNYIFSIGEDRTIRIWDAKNGSSSKTYDWLETDGQYDSWYQMNWTAAFSFDRSRIACGSYSGRIYIWEDRKQSFVLVGHTSAISSIAFAPDGQSFISGSMDGALMLWDANNGEQLKYLARSHSDNVTSFAFSTDGSHVASGSADTTICLWNVQNGLPVGESLRGHTKGICTLAFSPSGRYLASGSADMNIRVWDTRSGRSIATLHGHTYDVCSVSFSPDGTQIVSGSADMTIRVWNAPVPEDTHLLEGHDGPPEKRLYTIGDTPDLDWTMNEDGWVHDRQDRLLLWLPPDLRSVLLRPQNTMLISRQGCIELDFTGARLGDMWATCYHPCPPSDD